MAIGGCALLCLLALLTWIAVRIDQGVRLLRPPPAPPAEACKRLHVSDLAWYQRVRRQDEGEPFITAEDLPPFRASRRVDEDEVNPTFPVRPRR